MNNQRYNKSQINEGLRSGDLDKFVSDLFTVDQYKSKMGEDRDIVVLGFKVKEKYPAIDLMEFIEKGYKFILDADISAGEENDGQYQVFVEMKRSPNLYAEMQDLLSGISQLCDCKSWRFRYQKSPNSVEFNEQAVTENIPCTPEAYEQKILEIKTVDVKDFFDKGSTDLTLEADNTITFSRPYSGTIDAKLVAIGNYDDVKNTVPGKISLDESSQSQVLFLTKYLGRYEIDKIGNKFLIRNGDRAIVLEKNRW
jgi:hypothetical protein